MVTRWSKLHIFHDTAELCLILWCAHEGLVSKTNVIDPLLTSRGHNFPRYWGRRPGDLPCFYHHLVSWGLLSWCSSSNVPSGHLWFPTGWKGAAPRFGAALPFFSLNSRQILNADCGCVITWSVSPRQIMVGAEDEQRAAPPHSQPLAPSPRSDMSNSAQAWESFRDIL